VFLDIDGAFNNASFGSMDVVSGKYGVVLTLRRWIDAMLNVKALYALGSHATVFQSEVCAILACSEHCILKSIVNRAISVCCPLNCMPCLPELFYSVEILFRNWLCLTEFDWCGSLDTVESMEMRRLRQLQERDQILLL
jgi:hypothetical protein